MKESLSTHFRPRSKNIPAKLAAALLALGLGGGGYLCAKSFDNQEIVKPLSKKTGNSKPKDVNLSDINNLTRKQIVDVANVLGALMIAEMEREKAEPPLTPYEKELYDILLRFAESGDIMEFNEFMRRLGGESLWTSQSSPRSYSTKRSIDEKNSYVMHWCRRDRAALGVQ